MQPMDAETVEAARGEAAALLLWHDHAYAAHIFAGEEFLLTIKPADIASSCLHRDWLELDPGFVAKDHAAWLARIDAAAAKSREDFVANFLKEFAPPLPIWVSIECWDFGMLSYFVSGMSTPDRTSLAAHYQVERRDLELTPTAKVWKAKICAQAEELVF